MARPRGGASTLDEAVKDGPPKPGEDTGAPEAGTAPPGAGPVHVELPELPTTKSGSGGSLEDKTILLHGEPKIGKSTLASEFAGGDMLFFDCAGELSDLDVYRIPVGNWQEFRAAAAAYTAHMTGDNPTYRGCVIDTADLWASYCAQSVRRKLGIVHESDADWGKGWTMVKEELQSKLARLQVTPGGVILISHTKEVEIKPKRQPAYTRFVPTLAGGVREVIVNTADLILFIDWAEDGENRVIYTKPDPSFEAGERARNPRLPKEILWPIGRSGWDVLKEAWDGQ